MIFIELNFFQLIFRFSFQTFGLDFAIYQVPFVHFFPDMRYSIACGIYFRFTTFHGHERGLISYDFTFEARFGISVIVRLRKRCQNQRCPYTAKGI